MLQHLNNGWQVDQAILSEEDRIVLIRLFLNNIKYDSLASPLIKGSVTTGTRPA